jgi:hypothetical protein
VSRRVASETHPFGHPCDPRGSAQHLAAATRGYVRPPVEPRTQPSVKSTSWRPAHCLAAAGPIAAAPPSRSRLRRRSRPVDAEGTLGPCARRAARTRGQAPRRPYAIDYAAQ